MSAHEDKPENALHLREHNRRVVLNTLARVKRATRQTLALQTGLSLVTVATVLTALIEVGCVREGNRVPSAGGRPTQVYEFVPEHTLVLVLLTGQREGQDTLQAAVANGDGTVIDADDHPIVVTGLEAFEPAIDRMIARHPAIRGLGFALPGVENEGAIDILDYPALVGAPLVGHFARRYRLPVVFSNDVNAAVWGIRSGTPARETEVYLYFPVRYAPGAGIRVGNQMVKGHRHFAGEVGNLPLGIPWTDAGLFRSFDAACDAVARVVISVAAVVAPDAVVLAGEFLTSAHRDAIEAQVVAALPAGMAPAIAVSERFADDVRAGIVGLTLEITDSPPPATP